MGQVARGPLTSKAGAFPPRTSLCRANVIPGVVRAAQTERPPRDRQVMIGGLEGGVAELAAVSRGCVKMVKQGFHSRNN
jgi:hypothetical protein